MTTAHTMIATRGGQFFKSFQDIFRETRMFIHSWTLVPLEKFLRPERGVRSECCYSLNFIGSPSSTQTRHRLLHFKSDSILFLNSFIYTHTTSLKTTKQSRCSKNYQKWAGTDFFRKTSKFFPLTWRITKFSSFQKYFARATKKMTEFRAKAKVQDRFSWKRRDFEIIWERRSFGVKKIRFFHCIYFLLDIKWSRFWRVADVTWSNTQKERKKKGKSYKAIEDGCCEPRKCLERRATRDGLPFVRKY